MIVKLHTTNDMRRVSHLLATDPQAALRVLDRRIAAMAGNAQIIPFRTKSRNTVQSSPAHSGDAS